MKKALKDGAVYAFGEVVSRGMLFLLLPYLTYRLGSAEYAQLANLQSYIVLVLAITSLSQDGAITRYVSRYGARSVGLVVSSGLVAAVFIYVVLALVALAFSNYHLLLMLSVSTSQVLLGSQLVLRQARFLPWQYLFLQLFSAGLIALLTVSAFELLDTKFEYYFIAIAIANIVMWFIGLLLLFVKTSMKYKYSWTRILRGISYLLAFGVPLIAHQISFFVKGHLDRVFVYQIYPSSEVGVYAAGFQLATIFVFIMIALNRAAVPHLFLALKRDRTNFVELRKWALLSLIALPVPGLIAWLIPEHLYCTFLGKEFCGVKYFTALYLLGMALNIPYYVFVNYLFFYRETKSIAVASTISMLVHVVVLITLGNRSLHLAPFALLVSNVVLLAVMYMYCHRVNIRSSALAVG